MLTLSWVFLSCFQQEKMKINLLYLCQFNLKTVIQKSMKTKMSASWFLCSHLQLILTRRLFSYSMQFYQTFLQQLKVSSVIKILSYFKVVYVFDLFDIIFDNNLLKVCIRTMIIWMFFSVFQCILSRRWLWCICLEANGTNCLVTFVYNVQYNRICFQSSRLAA